MSTTGAQARDGQAAPDIKTAMVGFLSEFRSFQVDIKSKLHNQEERLTMLDRKTMFAGRPALSTTAEEGAAPHQKAFEAYLRAGEEEGLRGLQVESKALSTAVAADGGYLVDPETSDTVATVLSSAASIRAIANVVNVESTSFDVLIDQSEMGSGWATETGATIETDTPQIERITIPLHELSAMPKASQRLLDDSAFDIDGWLADRIAKKFARAEAAAFINGDGVDKPKGFLTHTVADNAIWSWAKSATWQPGLTARLDRPMR